MKDKEKWKEDLEKKGFIQYLIVKLVKLKEKIEKILKSKKT